MDLNKWLEAKWTPDWSVKSKFNAKPSPPAPPKEKKKEEDKWLTDEEKEILKTGFLPPSHAVLKSFQGLSIKDDEKKKEEQQELDPNDDASWE